jgi:glyoxylase-like metal-dependent hydrolase (beta-lactamase superfamily II)
VRHAQVERVAEGAWAVIALPDRGAVGNAGIVDLGGEALVFDTHFAPGAARGLGAAAEELAGPVRTVVNSHWHGDHVRGNASFDGAEILATAQTRELIATRGEQRLRELKETGLEEPMSDLRARGLDEELALLEELASELPTFEQRLPDRDWDEQLELGRATLLTWGGGHSASDSVLWLPAERVLFAADLAFVGRHLWAGDGDPAHWLVILDRIGELGLETLVPGHGPVGGAGDLDVLRDYLEALLPLPDDMPDRFAALESPEMWERNVAALRARVQDSAN